ncbi:MAG: NAD-dependent epimerase/dehydratase family protein [Poseidonibacter sp.]|uniref:polysaccharide biosynthesis C-terminal domain-containing protein n=1 Tax=Poseidonibacter sp. TaxID=2321188 RepID=UPI00359EF5FE
MKVLITGSNGFIAKNLIVTLSKMPHIEIIKYNKKNTLDELYSMIEESDFIFHLAGVNRPSDIKEFYDGNFNFTKYIVESLEKLDKKVPILFSSSTQVGNASDYSKSKEQAENIIENYSIDNKVNCFIYRLPNVFGKWSKPNYNSVIATWCYNLTRNIEIQVNNKDTQLELVYIGDVVHAFIDHLYLNNSYNSIYCKINKTYVKTLGEIEELMYKIKNSRDTLLIPNIASGFERVLNATYLSFLPKDKFSYKLNGHEDNRGTFYEILKTIDSGQLSISTTKPGITRGNHYHNTKNEKFLVIKGKALIELRDIFADEIVQYNVSADNLEIVEMIPGYTHNITNTGDDEMILLIWANENYDEKAPDTNFLKV